MPQYAELRLQPSDVETFVEKSRPALEIQSSSFLFI